MHHHGRKELAVPHLHVYVEVPTRVYWTKVMFLVPSTQEMFFFFFYCSMSIVKTTLQSEFGITSEDIWGAKNSPVYSDFIMDTLETHMLNQRHNYPPIRNLLPKPSTKSSKSNGPTMINHNAKCYIEQFYLKKIADGSILEFSTIFPSYIYIYIYEERSQVGI